MWVQAAFSPEAFWQQTPHHFQLAMQGVRKRLEQEAEARTVQAYEAGAFSALAQAGKLKQVKTYLRKSSAQTPTEMLSVIRALGAKSNMKIRRIKLGKDD